MIRHNLHYKSEWLEKKKILSYTIYTVNMDMMKTWSEHVLSSLRDWSGETFPALLFDISYPNVSMSYFVLSQRELFNVGITQQGKQDFLDYLAAYSSVDVKLAIVLSGTMLGALSNYMPPNYERSNFSPRIFFERKTASKWLLVKPDDALSNTGAITSESVLREMHNLEVSELDIYGNRDYLRILVNGSLEVIPLHEARPIIIGRQKTADLDLSVFGQQARTVSRTHAQISLVDERLTLIDLNSRNGTYLSGRKLDAGKTAFIRRDDIIRMGGVELQVMF